MNESVLGPDFPLLEIKAFVDATTVVLVGHRTEELQEGDELYVLGIGDVNIPGTDMPLVTPKAKLEVTFPADVYALARSPAEITRVPRFLVSAALTEMMTGQTVERREPLTKDESQFLGNPARKPVQIGDAVVPAKRIGDFIKWRSDARVTG